MNRLDICLSNSAELVKLVKALPVKDRVNALNRIRRRREDLYVLQGEYWFHIYPRRNKRHDNTEVARIDL